MSHCPVMVICSRQFHSVYPHDHYQIVIKFLGYLCMIYTQVIHWTKLLTYLYPSLWIINAGIMEVCVDYLILRKSLKYFVCFFIYYILDLYKYVCNNPHLFCFLFITISVCFMSYSNKIDVRRHVVLSYCLRYTMGNIGERWHKRT